MKPSFSRHLGTLLLACMVVISHGTAMAQPPAKMLAKGTPNLPPSADVSYAINANQRGLPLNGTAVVHWSAGKDHYSITTETRAMLVGKILESKSEGTIDAFGLVPLTAIEKRFRKEPTTTTFNRETGTITFSTSDVRYPIKGGEQDRNSVVWQLATMARSAPNKFKQGATIQMVVAGQKNADAWAFKVVKQEKIKTALGDLKTVKISKVIKDGGKEQKIDIWFAPSMEWYPVQLRFTEPEGDFIEQTVTSITPQS